MFGVRDGKIVNMFQGMPRNETSDAGGSQMILGRGKKVVNVAPLVVARDTNDEWIDMNRRAIATAGRKKRDEIERLKFEEIEDEYDSEEEEEEVVVLLICKNNLHSGVQIF